MPLAGYPNTEKSLGAAANLARDAHCPSDISCGASVFTVFGASLVGLVAQTGCHSKDDGNESQ